MGDSMGANSYLAAASVSVNVFMTNIRISSLHCLLPSMLHVEQIYFLYFEQQTKRTRMWKHSYKIDVMSASYSMYDPHQSGYLGMSWQGRRKEFVRRSRASVCLSLLLRQSRQSDTGSNHPAEQTKRKHCYCCCTNTPFSRLLQQTEVIKQIFGIKGPTCNCGQWQNLQVQEDTCRKAELKKPCFAFVIKHRTTARAHWLTSYWFGVCSFNSNWSKVHFQ